MSIGHTTGLSSSVASTWTQILNRYREPSHTRSAAELAITALPLAALWFAAWFTYAHGYWWAPLAIAVPAGGFLVRLFAIQHDCGHGSFFPQRWANDWVGRALGVLTVTPFDVWRRAHAIHHSSCGNLDRRGIGDIDTLTVDEYRARSRWGRLKYRIYRNPVVLFGIGPAYVFLLQQRLPIGMMRDGWRPWVSTQATNAAMFAIAAALIWLVGVQAFFLVHLPIVVIAASIGVWLFYVQHQFEGTFWSKARGWNFHEAALHGSSHYDLPWLLRWFTANIGIHHVHHLHARIPSYRLPRVLRDHPDLRQIGRLTLADSLRCVRLVLWDEEKERLVSFREARVQSSV
ncbi:fatty acid desaturase [Parvibaculum sp.]|uniref:fatty acid desaturase n=1 Tax=Parvibaculum sp. TaxID=2024848 RepID=UPI0034A038E4